MKIAAYGIAKNEEDNIVRWYESIKDADYILLLDTGSTDKTIEIAKSLGIDVRQAWFSPWDETSAKNTALSLIPLEYDYCLNIDIDQAINTPNWRQILEDNPGYITYSGNLKTTTGLGIANLYKDLTFIHQRKTTYWFSYRPIITTNNYLDAREKYVFHLDIEILDMPGTQERFNNREDLYIDSFKNAIEKIEKVISFNMLKGMYLNLSLACFEKEYSEDTIKYYLKYLNSANSRKDIDTGNFLEFAKTKDKVEIVMLLAISLILPQYTNQIYDKILNSENINEYWNFFIKLRKCLIYLKCNDLEKLKSEFNDIRHMEQTSFKDYASENEYTVMNISETEMSTLNIIKMFLDNDADYNQERADYLFNLIFSNIHYGKSHPELADKCFEYFKKEGLV